MTREEILSRLAAYLTELFEIPPERIVPEARLAEDLDLDSIDAVDLVIKLQDLTGRRVKPDEFKAVRTIGDVVATIEKLLAEDAAPSA